MKIAFWATVAGQIILLVAFIAVKENTLRTGTSVVLQTVPVDPLSLLQGEYVNLRYEISEIPGDLHPVVRPGEQFYVQLLEDSDGVWRGIQYGQQKPGPDRVFMRGTVGERSQLEFGINTYFIPEGTGRIIEQSADVKVRVAVSSGGTAVIEELLLNGEPFDPATIPVVPRDREPPPIPPGGQPVPKP
ncbi:MAG: GDYXXLXY domain-containing protein [Chloroflexi bacterium]|nr:GDYXXLXY domain-containing protein [Chloroflexota bacterium]